MADGGVKNRAKLFEQPSNDSTAPSPLRKPIVSNKPKVLSKPDAASTGKESEEVNPFKKFGVANGGAPVPLPKFKGGVNSALSPKDPKKDNSSDSNNNKSATLGEKNTKEGGPLPKKAILPPTSPKNALNAGGGVKPPTPGSKPIVGDKPKPQIPAKVPLVPQPEAAKKDVSKTDSVCSTSSNVSDASNSSNSPSTNSNVSDDKGKFDFSKILRPVAHNGLPRRKTIDSIGDESNLHSSTSQSHATPISPPSLPKPAPSLPTSPSNVKSLPKNEPAPSQFRKPDINLIAQRSKLRSRSTSVEKEEEETPLILRESDGKKFRKMTLQKTAHSEKPPEKPTLPKDIDLSTISKEYQKAKNEDKESSSVTPSTNQEKEKSTADEENESDDLIYDDSVSLADMRPKKEGQEVSRKSDRISMIPEMSPEEEGAFDDIPADELYTVAETDKTTKDEEPSETEQEKKRRKKQEKEQEKQRKKKEEEKEKQRKKQEEEEMKRRKTFSLTGKEKPVGEGEIKNDVKGGNMNLKARKGQKVTIVRIDNNPANKWLVKTDTQMGYVDSSNISVDPDIIKQKKSRPMTFKQALLNPFTAGKNLIEAMTNAKKDSAVEEDFDQPTYDAVPEDTSGGGSTPAMEDLEYEDVYEEF